MDGEGFPNQRVSDEKIRALKQKYEPLLWQKAEELAALRTNLKARYDDISRRSSALRAQPFEKLELSLRDELGKIESEYWRIDEKLREIESEESEIEQSLKSLEDGAAEESELEALVPEPVKETEHISKRKLRMLEERQRLGMDSRETAYDMYRAFGSNQAFGSNPTKLTTGRHLKSIKGSFDPAEAVGEFFTQTADTHGGKVPHGKNGGSYTTLGGRRIRKR